MPPLLSQVDHVKAKEFSAFLRHFGLSKCLRLFVEEWQHLVNQQMHGKSLQKRKKTGNESSSSSLVRIRKSPSLSTSSLHVLGRKNRVVTSVGVEDDLWEASGPNYFAPDFVSGVGVSLKTYRSAQQRGKVKLIPTQPYFKERPPSDLPLDFLDLRVVYYSGRTGSEEEGFTFSLNSVVAGRYQMLRFLDSAAFSHTVHCRDIKEDKDVCLKVIRNSKSFFDQSIDEIKLLKMIKSYGNTEENHLVTLYDYFYHKEHLYIVTEILGVNLYQLSKFGRKREEAEFYFTLPRLQAIAKQILTGLCFLHSLGVMHSDLKPENILIKSFSHCEVKIIDFGNSCFLTDNLSSYVQSRCYRAPEVILGCKYDTRIDIWSLGVILAELATGCVLFENDSVPEMLASICSVCGELPAVLLHEGRNTSYFVTKFGAFYEHRKERKELVFHFPIFGASHEVLFGYNDPVYIDFIRACLTIDRLRRPTAVELMEHPFLHENYGSAYSLSPPFDNNNGAA